MKCLFYRVRIITRQFLNLLDANLRADSTLKYGIGSPRGNGSVARTRKGLMEVVIGGENPLSTTYLLQHV